MYQLEKFTSGRFDVTAENGCRAGSIIGGSSTWMAELGLKLLGPYQSKDQAAQAILKMNGIAGLFEQMVSIVDDHLEKTDYVASDLIRNRDQIQSWKCATSFVWVLSPIMSTLLELDLSVTQCESKSFLESYGCHPDAKLFHIDVLTLKISMISLAQALALVMGSPRYKLIGNQIIEWTTPLADVQYKKRSKYLQLEFYEVRIVCRKEPSEKQVAVLDKIARFLVLPQEFNQDVPVKEKIAFQGKALTSRTRQ